MGLLRLYLSLCVVCVHAGISTWWTIHDGTQAVQIFFLISGFYMQMIANKYPDRISFWISRAVRIYVPYFAALVVSLVVAIGLWNLTGTRGPCSAFASNEISRNSATGVILASITNVTLVGQDLTLFVKDSPDAGIALTSHVHDTPAPLYRYVLIPQAWTVSLELYFYALVPFLAMFRTRWLGLALLASLGMRFFTYMAFGLTHSPWIYRFFPFEIALFIAGMLAWRFSEQGMPKFDVGWSKLRYLGFAIGAIVFFWGARKMVSFGVRYADYTVVTQISYCGWLIAIPLLFQITKRHQLDRFLGELSYPIYLLHMAIIPISVALADRHTALHPGALTLCLTLLCSVLFVVFLIRPLEKWRGRLHQPKTTTVVHHGTTGTSTEVIS